MSEDKQKDYLDNKTGFKKKKTLAENSGALATDDVRHGAASRNDQQGFDMIDEKIRDVLRTKKLATLVSVSHNHNPVDL